jgi:hypothetical protein
MGQEEWVTPTHSCGHQHCPKCWTEGSWGGEAYVRLAAAGEGQARKRQEQGSPQPALRLHQLTLVLSSLFLGPCHRPVFQIFLSNG